MDTPIQPRRSIPTELKPRLRYSGNLHKVARYSLSLGEWDKLTKSQRRLLTDVFGIPTLDWLRVNFYAWPAR